MKKILAFAVILALLLPAAAFAAAEFTLGGFVKLDTFWSSAQNGKNANTPIPLNNDPNGHHGRLKFTAQGSRFNLTIKGPDLWGAKTTGFFEMDFDANENPGLGNALSASNNYTPRLRHAMFRFNWPTTELLFGQYFSMFCEFYNESVQDGPLQGFGMPTARLAQVRVSQKFGDGFTIAALVGEPTAANGVNGANYTLPNNGENSETPQVQAKLMYQKDLWGKAAYYGAPMPFTARVIGGWQRNVYRSNAQTVAGVNGTATTTFGQNALNATAVQFGNHQYLDPWMLMANTFLPIIPTHSANLAGTASLSVQAFIGQGLGAFGNNSVGVADTYGSYAATVVAPGVVNIQAFDEKLYQQYGGYVQAQYYFTNHWFTNITYGMQKQFGVSQTRYNQLVSAAANAGGYGWVGANNPNFQQEVDFTLWYRPIQAIKFGLQYTWQRTQWMQVNANPATLINGTVSQANTSGSGTASRVEFVGFFYF
ncbi:MAG: hypothetical protein ACYC6G_10265 [Desulfobaccales bacterium]